MWMLCTSVGRFLQRPFVSSLLVFTLEIYASHQQFLDSENPTPRSWSTIFVPTAPAPTLSLAICLPKSLPPQPHWHPKLWRIFERNLLSFQNLTVMKVLRWKLDFIKAWKLEHWWGYLIENWLHLSLKRRMLMRFLDKKLKQIELKNQRFLWNKCRVLQAIRVWCWNCNVMEKAGMHHYNFVKNLNVTS